MLAWLKKVLNQQRRNRNIEKHMIKLMNHFITFSRVAGARKVSFHPSVSDSLSNKPSIDQYRRAYHQLLLMTPVPVYELHLSPPEFIESTDGEMSESTIEDPLEGQILIYHDGYHEIQLNIDVLKTDQEKIQALVHELGHHLMHSKENINEFDMEIEAELFSMVILRLLGVLSQEELMNRSRLVGELLKKGKCSESRLQEAFRFMKDKIELYELELLYAG